jgi:hypothetical protein
MSYWLSCWFARRRTSIYGTAFAVLALTASIPHLCTAQMLERCNAELRQKERSQIPSLTQADQTAAHDLLRQLKTKTDWTVPALSSGIILQGTLTFPSGEKHPIKIYYKGRRHLRAEETMSSGVRITIVSGLSALVVAGGTSKVVAPDAPREELSFLPFISDLGFLNRNVLYTSPSQVTVDGQSEEVIRALHFPAAVNAMSNLASEGADPNSLVDEFPFRISPVIAESEFFFDPATNLPVMMKSCSPLPGKSTTREVVRKFSSYTTVGNFVYPSQIAQTIGGSQPTILNITSLQLNQQLDKDLWSSTSIN